MSLYRYTLRRDGLGGSPPPELKSSTGPFDMGGIPTFSDEYQIYDKPLAGRVVWVMLNPSTATDEVDDPTIRMCKGFTKRWGYDALTVVNLFAFRTPYPDQLYSAASRGVDVVGPENDAAILGAVAPGSLVVCAWGRLRSKPFVTKRLNEVLTLLRGHRLHACGTMPDGMPRHPLMMKYGPPLLWRLPE